MIFYNITDGQIGAHTKLLFFFFFFKKGNLLFWIYRKSADSTDNFYTAPTQFPVLLTSSC